MSKLSVESTCQKQALKTQSVQTHDMFTVGFGHLGATWIYKGENSQAIWHRADLCLDSHLTGPQTNSEHLQDPGRNVMGRMME